MFLEWVIIVWPAIYGTIIGAILLGMILGYILTFLRWKNKKKAILFAKEKRYSTSIEILNKITKSRMFSKMELSEVHMILAVMYLIIFNEEQFVNSIAKVSYKKHLTLKSFWESLYYLEKKDKTNYERTKENITNYFNLNCKTRNENQSTLNTYYLILQLLEEKERVEKQEELRNLCQTFLETKILLKEYLSKFF
ncbi:MAG: hypothetical protein NC310_09115 [Roseburia sp.]|nr:hypothetical protein [Roseburia sp.]MCM1557908.1 hypothetical protein [Anaeroplasma bactoclasticum]